MVDGLGWRGGLVGGARVERVGVGWRGGGRLAGGGLEGVGCWLEGAWQGAGEGVRRKGWVWLEGGLEGGLAGGG